MNLLTHAQVKNLLLGKDGSVTFVFDLVLHPLLKDPAILKPCMDAYATKYRYQVDSWEAFTQGNDLYIVVYRR